VYEQQIDSLAYLHDATVEEITWLSTQESRTVVLRFTCSDDCGKQEWNDQHVVVTCSDVLLCSSLLLGHVSGHDTFDSHSVVLSTEVTKALEGMLGIGITRPNVLLRIALHSGSELQLACDRIDIVVGSTR